MSKPNLGIAIYAGNDFEGLKSIGASIINQLKKIKGKVIFIEQLKKLIFFTQKMSF